MTGFSTYLENAHLNWIKGTQMPAPPSQTYLALFSADPTDAGVLTNEVTSAVRTAGRVPITWGAITKSGNLSTMSDAAVVDFGIAQSTVTATHFAVMDALTGGNMLESNTLANGNIVAGNAVSFAAGALVSTDA